MFKRFLPVLASAALVVSLGLGSVVAASTLSRSTADASDIELTGVVQALPEEGAAGTWVIQGIKVQVGADTELDADLSVGSTVKVQGTLDKNGVVVAREIETETAQAAEIEFDGAIQSLPEAGLIGTWTVDGLMVTVTANTEIEDEVEAGDAVKVEGNLNMDGSVLAREIEAEEEAEIEDEADEARLEGTIESLPTGSLIGTWMVDGTKVIVTADTRLDEDFVVGDKVKVRGDMQADGSILASRVQEDRSGPSLKEEDRDNRGHGNADDEDEDREDREARDNRGRGNAEDRDDDRGGNRGNRDDD